MTVYRPPVLWRSKLKSFVFLLCLIGLSGCVSTIAPESRPLVETTLIVTRSGQDIFLQWASERNVYYTVLYTSASRPGGRWVPLSGCVKMRGTGANLNVRDRAPVGVQRRYRLHVEPLNVKR